MNVGAGLAPPKKEKNMKKILITGTVMTADGDSIKIYNELVNICKKISDNVYSPLDNMKFKGNDN